MTSGFETVCPACQQAFDIGGDWTEGRCPFCAAQLQFLDEEPATAAAPLPGIPPHPSLPEPVGPPRARPGEFSTTCPACLRPHVVGAEAREGACPGCGAPLRYKDAYAEPPALRFSTACPSCGAALEVTPREHEGRCGSCGAGLVYEDVWPGEPMDSIETEAPPPLPPPAEALPAAPPAAAPAAAEEAPAEAAPDPPAKKKGLFRRFKADESFPKKTTAAKGDAPPRAEPAPKDGHAYVLSCPQCSKEFEVPPGEKEGNCPHCKAPLAFLTEKEHTALEDAAKRKAEFQRKLQARREAQRAAEEERLARVEKRREQQLKAPKARGGAKPSLRRRLLAWRRRAQKEAPADEELAAAEPEAPAPETPAPKPEAEVPAPPPKRFKATPAKKEPAEEPAPAAEEEPAAPAPAKPGVAARFKGFFGRKRAPQQEAVATPEGAAPGPIEAPRKASKKKAAAAEELAAAAPVSVEVTLDAPAAPAPAPKKAKKAPPEKPAEVAPAVFELGGDVEAAAPAEAEPKAPKRSFLSRFGLDRAPSKEAAPEESPRRGFRDRLRRRRSAGAEAPAASVDLGGIEIEAPQAAEKASGKGRRKKEKKKAKDEQAAAVTVEATVEIDAAPAARRRR